MALTTEYPKLQTLRPTKAPNLLVAPSNYSQHYLDQLNNVLRLYFNEIDNFTQASTIPDSGTTQSRPVQFRLVGQMYFDTDLGVPIFWDGTTWITAGSISPSSVISVNSLTGVVVLDYSDVGAPSANGVNATGTWDIDITGNAANGNATGSIQMWSTATAPTGYLICNGSSVSTTTYADLFAVIGYTFGGSGGSFSLPNYTNRMPYGATIGTTGGSADAVVVSHTHTASSSVSDPGHTHTASSSVSDPGHLHISGTSVQFGTGVYGATSTGSNSSTCSQSGQNDIHDYTSTVTTGVSVSTTNTAASTGITVGTTNTATGVSGVGQNIPPYLGINFIIKT